MHIPAVTREYNPGLCHNSRNPMRLPTHREMRPNSLALRAEQFRFRNETRKELQFAWLNSKESPRSLSQDEKNTDVTSGMHNNSVHTKSNWDEANFPYIGSITILRSKSYRTSGLTPFRKLQRLTETPASSIEDHQFQYINLRNVLSTPYHPGMRMNPCLRLKR